jgi:1-deoxy-D-xylulose 5-phosphate reductoisomerase
MPFSNYRDNFDSETLAILEAAFNEAWEVLTNSGGSFDEATRNALADLIMSFASEGEIWTIGAGFGS